MATERDGRRQYGVNVEDIAKQLSDVLGQKIAMDISRHERTSQEANEMAEAAANAMVRFIEADPNVMGLICTYAPYGIPGSEDSGVAAVCTSRMDHLCLSALLMAQLPKLIDDANLSLIGRLKVVWRIVRGLSKHEIKKTRTEDISHRVPHV